MILELLGRAHDAQDHHFSTCQLQRAKPDKIPTTEFIDLKMGDDVLRMVLGTMLGALAGNYCQTQQCRCGNIFNPSTGNDPGNASIHCHACRPNERTRSSLCCSCGNSLHGSPTYDSLNRCGDCREQGWAQVKHQIRTENAHWGTLDVLKILSRVAPEFFFPATTHIRQHDLMTPETTIYVRNPSTMSFSARGTPANIVLIRIISDIDQCKHALYVWIEPHARVDQLANAVCGVKPSLTENVTTGPGGSTFRARNENGGARTVWNHQIINSAPLGHCDTLVVRGWL